MTAGSLISEILQPLSPEDKGMYALDQMTEFRVRHLPLVENEQLLGLISEEDILNYDLEQTIASYSLYHNRPSVFVDNHIYEILRLMADFNLTAIPVINKENKYLGVITQEDVLRTLGSMGTFSLPGSIVVLEMNRKDYSLAHISSVIEQENAAVISTFITSNLDTNTAEVTLKINKKDILRIVASLQRHGYHVKASFQESEYLNDNSQERFDSFMMYLNV